MADPTAPVKPGVGAGPEAMAAYTKALDAYTKAQEAKAKAAEAASAAIAKESLKPVNGLDKAAERGALGVYTDPNSGARPPEKKPTYSPPYVPVDTTGKPAAPITPIATPAIPLVSSSAKNPSPSVAPPAPSVAPYQAQLAGQAASVPFTQGQDALAMTDEEKKVAKGQAAEKEALAAGKSAQEAKAIGLQAYMDYKGPEPEQKIITPTQIGGPKEYAPGEQRTGVENPKFYPQTIDSNPLAQADVSPKKASAIDAMIAKLDAESKSGGPNIADFIEAAAAGWNGRKAAYLEKEAKKADVKADLEKLAKTATMEKELQDERLAGEERIARLKLDGVGGVMPTKKGDIVGAKMLGQIGG